MAKKNKLALLGGRPLATDHSKLKIDWPIISKSDRESVINAFDKREFSGRGSAEVRKLEAEFSAYFNMPFATALNSGTSALHAALYSLGLGENDGVIVPNFSFVASAMAVVHNGSVPIFADIDKRTYNISPESIEQKIDTNTKAVIVVHMHGIPVDMDPIMDICKAHKLLIIEDVAQAPGAKYKGKLLGSFGDASIFSLMSQKNLATCGECGMLLSNTLKEKNRAEMLRIYGEVLRPEEERTYNTFTLGWNYTLNPIQASMARSQLEKFNSLTKEIRVKGTFLSKKLSKLPWLIPPLDSNIFEGVFHFFRVRIDGRSLNYPNSGKLRLAVQHALNAEGLNVRMYQNTGLSEHSFFKNSYTKHDYQFEDDYPGVTDVIRNTIVIGAIGSSPAYLLCPGTPELYIEGFYKISDNMQDLIEYAEDLEYSDPWLSVPVISDSFGVQYV